MVGGLGFVIIFIIILRHIGACIRDGHQNNYLKNSAMQKGYDTYYDAQGYERDLKTNQKVVTLISPEFGVHITNLSTKEETYPEVQEMCNKYFKDKSRPHEGTVWRGRLRQTYMYIDYGTDQMMRKARTWIEGKGTCEFYTDFWTRTKVLRKTDKQIKSDEINIQCDRNDKVVTLDEIRESFYYEDNNDVDRIEKKWKMALPLGAEDF